MSITDLAALDYALNQLILGRRRSEALERFYADDVVVLEPSAPPCRGKDRNRERERRRRESVDTTHTIELAAWAVGDGVTMAEWRVDLTLRDGRRQQREYVTVRRWRDGLVASERVYYDAPGDVSEAAPRWPPRV